MKRDTGGPAFPFVEPSNECNVATGMTLRDYFAAQVLPAIYEEHFNGIRNKEYQLDPDWKLGLALDAYEMADAMMEARKK